MKPGKHRQNLKDTGIFLRQQFYIWQFSNAVSRTVTNAEKKLKKSVLRNKKFLILRIQEFTPEKIHQKYIKTLGAYAGHPPTGTTGI